MKYSLSHPENRKLAIENFKGFLDSNVNIELKKLGKIRTLSQNRLYWLYLGMIEDYTGQDSEELHEYFKTKYLGYMEVDMFNELTPILKSTKNLNTKQFTDYIEEILKFASMTLSLYLPSPDDKNIDAFVQQNSHLIRKR